MPVIYRLARRVSRQPTPASTTTNLLIALVVLFATVALLVGSLLILHQIRRNQEELDRQLVDALPGYSEKPPSRSPYNFVVANLETECLLSSESSCCDVPEIRVTFPDELDETGKRMSGRVVVVRLGDHSVGLEPVAEELPAYERTKSDKRFQSLDLATIGGLKEKDYN